MPIHAFVATVRTRPEPAVLAVLDSCDEVFADFLGGGFGVPVFAEDDLAKFGFHMKSAHLPVKAHRRFGLETGTDVHSSQSAISSSFFFSSSASFSSSLVSV